MGTPGALSEPRRCTLRQGSAVASAFSVSRPSARSYSSSGMTVVRATWQHGAGHDLDGGDRARPAVIGTAPAACVPCTRKLRVPAANAALAIATPSMQTRSKGGLSRSACTSSRRMRPTPSRNAHALARAAAPRAKGSTALGLGRRQAPCSGRPPRRPHAGSPVAAAGVPPRADGHRAVLELRDLAERDRAPHWSAGWPPPRSRRRG